MLRGDVGPEIRDKFRRAASLRDRGFITPRAMGLFMQSLESREYWERLTGDDREAVLKVRQLLEEEDRKAEDEENANL